MKVQIFLFFVFVTLFVIAFLWWNLTKGDTPIYTTPKSVTPGRTMGMTLGMTPGRTMGLTIPPQLDVPKAAQIVNQQTIRNLNRMYGNGKLPVKSDYAGLAASGKVYWNPNVGSWQATSGKAVGYTGVGNPSAMDVQNLNRMYGSGKVPQGSRLSALADSNKVAFVGGRWVSNVNSGPQAAGIPNAAQTVNQQTIRNLNRMYGNGKLPSKSDYAGLAASGKVYWNPNVGSWQATSGQAVGYTGVGNPTNMDVQNLNRMYGNGNVPQGSRLAALADSNKVGFIGGRWVSLV
jgi:hypothetical protein